LIVEDLVVASIIEQNPSDGMLDGTVSTDVEEIGMVWGDSQPMDGQT
jgi:hypothetical protein